MNTMYRMAVTFVLALFTFPSASLAASGAALPDFSTANDALDFLTREQDRQDASDSFYRSADLFPDVENGTSGTIDDQRNERTDGLLVIRVGTKDVTLRDVPLREWYAPYIRDVAEKQLVSGYRNELGDPIGAFGPADPVTLEQMAKVAVLAAGINVAGCPLPPQNLSASGAWSAGYISCAEKRGWAVYSDASLDLHRPATREEVIMTILQAYEREFIVNPGTIPFTDVQQTSAYAPAIATAAHDGVVSGYTDEDGRPTGLFGPQNNVTRAEFAKIVSITLQLYRD